MFSIVSFLFFFFFQAEDGIRDVAVTGVQTCALPISPGWLWTIPTVPTHPASSHVWRGSTWVRVEYVGSTSAGAMRSTYTTGPRTSPIMQPMNSVGERYASVR